MTSETTRTCDQHPTSQLRRMSVGSGLECPECHRRFCRNCGQYAMESWQTGLCSRCYGVMSRETAKRDREEHDLYVERRALRAAADAIHPDNTMVYRSAEVADWLRKRADSLDAPLEVNP